MTMYEMIRNTPTFDLHGASAYITIAQDVFDYAPQNLLIHYLLEQWRSLPAEEINQSLQAADELSLYILKSLRFSDMEWLDALLLAVSPGAFAAVKFLAFMREFTIGYIEYMSSLDAETRVKSMERFLFSYTQIDYFIGIFQGIVDGVVDWFKDIWAIFEGIYNFITELPKYYKQIKEAFGDASQLVIDLITFLNDPSSAESISDLLKNFNPLDIFTWIDTGIEAAGQSAGKSTAKEIIGFLNLSPIALGQKVGWLIGYLIPEILLAVFSAGIGTAVKIGFKALAKVMQVIFDILGKVVRVTLQAIKTALRAIDDVIKSIKSIAAFFVKTGKEKLAPFFLKLEELFKKFKEFLRKKEKSPDTDKPDIDSKDVNPDDKNKMPEKDGDDLKESDKFDEEKSSLDESGKVVDDLVGFRKDHILNRHRAGSGKPGAQR